MNRTAKVLLVLYLVFTLAWSFYRYSFFPIDGDLPAIVMAHKSYQTVMQDPFGMNVLLKDSVYPAPNRYFAHLSMAAYFKNVPQLLQRFTNPIDSIYDACALAKTGIQIFLIFLLAACISGKMSLRNPDFLMAAGIVTPLFQVFGYHSAIGLVDASVTYAFFYGLALGLLILFFMPLFLGWFHDYKIRRPVLLCLFPLALIVAFHGPLNPAVVVLVCVVAFLALFVYATGKQENKPAGISWGQMMHASPAGVITLLLFAFGVSLYSLYIGQNNIENLWDYLPLGERYARLPYGFYLQYLDNPALPMLLACIGFNIFQLRKNQPGIQTQKLSRLLKWMAVGCMLFLLALPLGGYRAYRPYILRMDSVMPVTLVLLFCYGITTYSLLQCKTFRHRKIYVVLVVLFSAHFVLADTEIRKENACEKASLQKLATASEKTVLLDSDCPVLSWHKTTDPVDSDVKTDLLLRWGVLKEKKYFYQANE